MCRRICVLRERGQLDDAAQLEATDLAALLAVCRRTGNDAEITPRLDAIFAAEEERVANAAVLAELLVPLLSRELHTSLPASPLVAPAALPASSAAPAPSRPPRAEPPDIAGFIDEMLALDEPMSHRRAS